MTPERLMPASRARICETPIATPRGRLRCRASACPPASASLTAARRDGPWGADPAAVGQGATADELAAEEDDAVDGQEDRGGEGLGELRAELVLEGQADDAHRDGAEDDEPGQALVGLPRWRAPDRADRRHRRCGPTGAGSRRAGPRRADVQADEEGEEEGLLLGLRIDQVVPAEQGGDQHAVAEAGDREELGHALDEADDDRLQVRQLWLLLARRRSFTLGHRAGPGHRRPPARGRCRLGAMAKALWLLRHCQGPRRAAAWRP